MPGDERELGAAALWAECPGLIPDNGVRPLLGRRAPTVGEHDAEGVRRLT